MDIKSSTTIESLSSGPSENELIAQIDGMIGTHQYPLALQLVEEGLVHFPDSTSLLVLRGKMCFKLRQYANARDSFQAVLADGKENIAALSGSALLAERLNQWRLAVHFWDRCIAADNSATTPVRWLSAKAAALVRAGSHDEAEALYHVLIKQHVNRPAGIEGLAMLAQSRGDWSVALEHWQRCIDLFKRHRRARFWYVNMANAYITNEQYDEASRIYHQMLDVFPKECDACEGLAKLAERQHQWHVALDRYRDCIDEFPSHARKNRWYSAVARLSIKINDSRTAGRHAALF